MKDIINNLDKSGLVVLFALNALVIWIYSLTGIQASESYYLLSIYVTAIGVPLILFFIYTLYKDPKLSLLLFILIFPVLPSITNLLGTFGGGLIVALVELLISSLIFFAISSKYKSILQPTSIMYFTIFWVASNTCTYIISDFSEKNLIGYILSYAFIFTLLSLSKIFTILRKEEGKNFFKIPLNFFFISLFLYLLSCYLLLYASEGSSVFSSLFTLTREIEFSGMAYIDFNAMSGISILLIPLVLYYFNAEEFLFKKLILISFILLIFIIVLVDKSRGGFVTLIALFGFLTFQNVLARSGVKSLALKSRMLMIFSLLSIGLLAIYYFGDVFISRIAGAEEGTLESVRLIDIVIRTLVSSRGALLIEGYNKFLESPFFGHGYGTLLYISSLNVYWDSHSQILESLISIGVIGTGTLVYLILSTFITYKKNKINLDNDYLRLSAALWTLILTFGVYGLTTGIHLIDTGSRVSFFPIYLYSFFVILLIHLCEESKSNMSR